MGIDFTGTADHVAGMMQEIMEEVGGDGFLFFNAYFDRRYIMEVCDGLVPELQRRGLTRTRYAHKHFKDNLLEFVTGAKSWAVSEKMVAPTRDDLIQPGCDHPTGAVWSVACGTAAACGEAAG